MNSHVVSHTDLISSLASMKSLSIKSSRTLRSSEKKKFLSRLPAAAASVFDQQKQTFSLLRAVTSKGSAFKIYLCDGTPMFFECDKGDEDATLLPSVFFTWIAPSCYPIICVHSSLLETLRGGADLMAPGIREIATSQEFEANSPVTVALLPASGESRKVDGPALVGKSLLSLHEILSSGGRGRAVQIYHSIHDALWELGDRTIPMPKITLPIVGDSEREHQPEGGEATVDALSRLELNESAVNGGGKSPEKTSSVEVDMESVLRDTFFSAIRWKIKDKQGVAFPIDTGQFYANYVLKCLPSSDQKLELKRTRYKKFSTFLKLINEEEAEGGAGEWVVKVNSRKGLDSIEDINFLHPRVVDAKPLSTEDESMRDAIRIEVVECYSVTDASLSFLSHCNMTNPVRRSDLIRLDGVRAAIESYVREKSLLRAGKRVELDDQLQMLMKNFAPGATVDLNSIVQKLVSQMTPAWSVKLADGRQKVHRSKIPCIEFKVEKRAGNKLVTLVNNLEVYGIDAKELCHHVHATGSTTTPNAPNCVGAQVLLQGNQVNPIYKLIQTTYGISTKYLKGLELGVKEEKRKKKN